jgi:hypothetical protein
MRQAVTRPSTRSGPGLSRARCGLEALGNRSRGLGRRWRPMSIRIARGKMGLLHSESYESGRRALAIATGPLTRAKTAGGSGFPKDPGAPSQGHTSRAPFGVSTSHCVRPPKSDCGPLAAPPAGARSRSATTQARTEREHAARVRAAQSQPDQRGGTLQSAACGTSTPRPRCGQGATLAAPRCRDRVGKPPERTVANALLRAGATVA